VGYPDGTNLQVISGAKWSFSGLERDGRANAVDGHQDHEPCEAEPPLRGEGDGPFQQQDKPESLHPEVERGLRPTVDADRAVREPADSHYPISRVRGDLIVNERIYGEGDEAAEDDSHGSAEPVAGGERPNHLFYGTHIGHSCTAESARPALARRRLWWADKVQG